MKHISYILSILLFIGTLALSLSATTFTATITKVVDGDTIHVNHNNQEEKIRILYIDTPEKYSGAKMDKDAKKAGISVKDEEELGRLATGYAIKFFPKGTTLILDAQKKDRYGRTLASISKNGIDYSKSIIQDGYACIYKKAPYPKEFDGLLNQAKQGKKGLWGVNFEVMNKLCR